MVGGGRGGATIGAGGGVMHGHLFEILVFYCIDPHPSPNFQCIHPQGPHFQIRGVALGVGGLYNEILLSSISRLAAWRFIFKCVLIIFGTCPLNIIESVVLMRCSRVV